MGFGGYLQANTAVDVLIGPFVDDTDGKTAETALTLSQGDIKLSKNGQALAQKNDDTAAAADANGYYNCELDATDTNTEGTLTLIVHESGALPVRHDFMVISQAAYASLVTAKDTGYMDVNIKAVSEDTTAADNLELACDNYSATRGLSGTALPAAAADAAGGLPISDAGGLDLDAKVGALTFTVAGDVDVNVQSWKGAAAADMTGDAFARIGAPAGASLSADVAAVKSDSAAILADTGTDGVVLPQAQADKVWGTAVRTLTANTNLNDPTAAAIADAVWDEVSTGHTDAGKAGAQVWTDIDAILEDTGTTLQNELDGIQADTEDIQARIPAALVSGRINANVAAVNDVAVDGAGTEGDPWGPAA